MTLTEPQLQATLEAALNRVKSAVMLIASRLPSTLGNLAGQAGRAGERDLLFAAQFDLNRNIGVFENALIDGLRDKVKEQLSPKDSSRLALGENDWQSLTLVDDTAVEDQMQCDRIVQVISYCCEVELRDLAGYVAALMGADRADPDQNPLRPQNVGSAVFDAIEGASEDIKVRSLLVRELGALMGAAMKACYAQIVEDLRDLGIQPVALVARIIDSPAGGSAQGHAVPGSTSFGTSRHDEYSAENSRADSRLETGLGQSRFGPTSSSSKSGIASQFRTSTGNAADQQLMALLRRLTAFASGHGALGAGSPHIGPSEPSSLGPSAQQQAQWTQSYASVDQGLPGMTVNLIRAHREELMQASTGKLDHLVIDVVGSLFDQILSDGRVPPQMARQIARLQLPVLRVALSDSTFFSSRRHPVRRFVNGMASLACAFDDLTSGPGQQFLIRVSSLVQEIVDGDFDQIAIYASKLAALEAFAAEQAHQEVQATGAVGTLAGKEVELRLQQRYMLQLQAALAPIALPAYLSAFLSQVWSQAVVLATTRDGADSERNKRFRRVGSELVMSVQPKGAPAQRKKFLMQLPQLMKDLNEGIQLVGWPEAAKREFFGQLLPAHAESLKLTALSELDYNLMSKKLEAVFNIPVPRAETLSSADRVPETNDLIPVEERFTAEEAKKIGLVAESTVDWSGKVDIELDADAGPETQPALQNNSEADGKSAPAVVVPLLDLNLSESEAPEPTQGVKLMNHISVGFAYQMHLKNEWQKVRLAHVSASRGFFMFSTGVKQQETISMTARMLSRMCETGRFRTVETSHLMDRATQRARKELAASKTPLAA